MLRDISPEECISLEVKVGRGSTCTRARLQVAVGGYLSIYVWEQLPGCQGSQLIGDYIVMCTHACVLGYFCALESLIPNFPWSHAITAPDCQDQSVAVDWRTGDSGDHLDSCGSGRTSEGKRLGWSVEPLGKGCDQSEWMAS